MLPVRIILLLLAGILYLLKNVWSFSPYSINVMNDLLAVPVFLIVMEIFMKLLYGSRFRLTLVHVLVTTGVIAVLFEGIFPLVSPQATADIMDLVWYTSGGSIYFVFHHFTQKQKTTVSRK